MNHVSVYCVAPICAAGFASVLKESDGFSVANVFYTIDSMEEYFQTNPQGLFLMEAGPEVSLDLLDRVIATARNLSVILWADPGSTAFLSQAVRLGVRGVLFRNSPVEVYLDCMKAIASGQMWIERELATQLMSADSISLTRRERQIMGLIAQGLANKEISWSLGISEGTVKVYLSRLFDKIGASDRFELALIALKYLSAGQLRMIERVPARSGDRAVPLPMPKLVSRTRLSSLAS